jgi:hypothetical protein
MQPPSPDRVIVEFKDSILLIPKPTIDSHSFPSTTHSKSLSLKHLNIISPPPSLSVKQVFSKGCITKFLYVVLVSISAFLCANRVMQKLMRFGEGRKKGKLGFYYENHVRRNISNSGYVHINTVYILCNIQGK